MENFLIAIGTFIIGYVTGIYLPLKFRKEDKTPNISISPFQERQNYFDVTNHGGDILDLTISIAWLQDSVRQTRSLTSFFNYNEDPALGYPHNSSALKRGETKKVINCPLYSDKGEVEVTINGRDVSGKTYSNNLILKNHKK